MHILTNWQRERRIRKVLVGLSRQRVGLISQSSNVWIVEKAINEHEEGVAEALRTCRLRGWVEMSRTMFRNFRG